MSFSRRIFLRFYPDAAMPMFLRGHVDAFATFGGVPRTLRYDNLKSAVLERAGDAVRFHPTLLALSAHYHFAPSPCRPYRGNEKGRVEGIRTPTRCDAQASRSSSPRLARSAPQLTDPPVCEANLHPLDERSHGVVITGRRYHRHAGGGLVMSERGFRGHPRVSSHYRAGDQGEGTLGYGVQDIAPNGNGGGGGGRLTCECCWAGAGGGGGHATGGANGSGGGAVCQPGGNAGLAVGSGAQTTIFFGGAGANGGAEEDGYGSAGAHGGGIIYVASAAISVESPGFIRNNGQVGQNEFNVSGCGSGGGGGGGAGGAVYLRASAAALGAGLITVSGGLGGDDPGNCGTPGGIGSVGRITLRGSSTTTGSTTPAFVAVP